MSERREARHEAMARGIQALTLLDGKAGLSDVEKTALMKMARDYFVKAAEALEKVIPLEKVEPTIDMSEFEQMLDATDEAQEAPKPDEDGSY